MEFLFEMLILITILVVLVFALDICIQILYGLFDIIIEHLKELTKDND